MKNYRTTKEVETKLALFNSDIEDKVYTFIMQYLFRPEIGLWSDD